MLLRGELDQNFSQNDPRSWTYMFGGRQMGLVGNDGTGNVDYATGIANRIAAPGTGAFRGGATSATIHADFDANFQALNGDSAQGHSLYVVAGEGDTLATIAARLWGDTSLWYKLAEANGLGASDALTPGRTLTVPGNVGNVHHNDATFKPYDPAEALGNLSPTAPKPPKQGNKCGAFGAILLTIVAVAVTAIVAPWATGIIAGNAIAGSAAAIGGAIAGGAIGGIAGSVASQAVGLATGIQDKFSWKQVALAGISGAIGGGMQAGKVFSGIGSSFVRGAVTGATANALSQGVAVATGLQSKFDFAGVALAGLGSGAASALGGAMGAKGALAGVGRALGGFGRSLATNSAGGIANAAARTLISGGSFGDNLIRALPDVIGSTVGNALAGMAMGTRGGSANAAGAGQISVTDWRGASKGGALFELASLLGNGVSSGLVGGAALTGGAMGSRASEPAHWLDILPGDGGNAWMVVNGGDEPTITIVGQRLPRRQGGGMAQGFLGRSVDDIQWALDGVSSYLTSRSNAAYSSYLNATAGWENNALLYPVALFTDFQAAAYHRAANIVSGLPSAFAHPVQTELAVASGIHGLAMDNRSVVQVGRDVHARVSSMSSRQLSQAGGALWADAVLMRAPARAMPATRFTATRNLGIDAAEAQAAARLAQMENAIPDAHFLAKHGPETTRPEQRHRATMQEAPNGALDKKHRNSSRFLSYSRMQAAMDMAETERRASGLTQGPIVVELPYVVGEGYLAGGLLYGETNFATVRFRNGKPLTAYPNLDRAFGR